MPFRKSFVAIAAVGALAISLAFVWGQKTTAMADGPTIIRAQEFQLVNKAGVTRASISLSSKEHLLIALHDDQGKMVDILVVTPELIASSKATAVRLQKLEEIMSRMFPAM